MFSRKSDRAPEARLFELPMRRAALDELEIWRATHPNLEWLRDNAAAEIVVVKADEASLEAQRALRGLSFGIVGSLSGLAPCCKVADTTGMGQVLYALPRSFLHEKGYADETINHAIKAWPTAFKQPSSHSRAM